MPINNFNQFIEVFDLDNSEWANDFVKINGEINNLTMFHAYIHTTFAKPIDYLKDVFSEFPEAETWYIKNL